MNKMDRCFLTFCSIFVTFCGALMMGVTNGAAADADRKAIYKYSASNNIDIKSNNNINDDVSKEGIDIPSKRFNTHDVSDMQKLTFIASLSSQKPLSIVKRAPNGFIGMRGKKHLEFSDDDWHDMLDHLYDTESSVWEDSLNTWTPERNGERFKKAPSAFYGVRGKKFAGGCNPYGNLQALMQNLHAERIREGLLQDFIDNLAPSSEYLDAIEKRTPAGFMGMRGKRQRSELDDENDDDGVIHQTFKRSPSKQMSFYGTRGKKYTRNLAEFRNKFVGVRGKKSYASPSDFTRKTNLHKYK